MSASIKPGFTIIETVLFLAVSGFLIAAIFVGTGTSLNRQRYRDSVSSLQSFLQKQYSEIANVSNNNSDSYNNICNRGEKLRGQSDCILLGRLITKPSGSNTFSIRNIIGYTAVTSTFQSDDVADLNNYTLMIPTANNLMTYDTEWGASLRADKISGRNNMYFSILILRSPSSGSIRTFVRQNYIAATSAQAKNLISSTYIRSLKMCVVDPSRFDTALTVEKNSTSRRAVIINMNSTDASGVELLTESSSGC